MPYDFFMSRYKEAYVQETLAFVECLVNDKPSPCSGEDGLIALVMAIAAGKSAEENRWVKFSELAPDLCMLNDELPCGNTSTQEECELAVVDSDGGIAWNKITSSPAQTFERTFAPFWVPPREAARRPELRKMTRKSE